MRVSNGFAHSLFTISLQEAVRPNEPRNMSGGAVSSTFSWLDYGVLVLTLVLSSLVGVYFGCFGAKIKSMAEFLNGDRKLKTIPIAISLIAR